jgi:hypothetical protein
VLPLVFCCNNSPTAAQWNFLAVPREYPGMPPFDDFLVQASLVWHNHHYYLLNIAENIKTITISATYAIIETQYNVSYPRLLPTLKNQNICESTGNTNVRTAANRPDTIKAITVVQTWITSPRMANEIPKRAMTPPPIASLMLIATPIPRSFFHFHI